MTGKQTPPKREAEVQGRKCYSYDKPHGDTVLLTIILPPVIMEKQDLCAPCLAVATVNSMKKGKMTQ